MAIERDNSNKLEDTKLRTPYTCKDLSARIRAYMEVYGNTGFLTSVQRREEIQSSMASIPALHTNTGPSPAGYQVATRVVRNHPTPVEYIDVTLKLNPPADMDPHEVKLYEENKHVPPPEGELEGPVTPFGRKPVPYLTISSNPSFDLHTITTDTAFRVIDPRPWEKYLGQPNTLDLQARIRQDIRSLDQADLAERRVTPERVEARVRLQDILDTHDMRRHKM